MISRSGRAAGLEGSELNAFSPTLRRLGPGLPSTTTVKLLPKGRW